MASHTASGSRNAEVVWLTNIQQRWLRVRLAAGLTLYGRCGPRTIRTGSRTLYKFGWDVDESEAEAMGFIRDHTSVPVPAVRCVYKYGKVTYIKMDFLPGKEAYIIWDRMPSADQQSVLAELESYVRQIRSLVPPSPGLVASVDGGSCWDHRIGTRRAGPFSNHDDFHRFLRLDSDLSRWDDDNDRDKMVVDSHSQKYLSKFTHGDLVPRNVLVHEGRISAIIDWDCAGWRPEYWESTKARFAPLGTPEVWFDALDRACGDPYTPQLKGEYRLWEAAECPSTPVQTVVNGRWM